MNNREFEAFKLLVERHTRENTRTPELARASLVREGYITEDGDLTPQYGGPPREGDEDMRSPGDLVTQALDRARRDDSPASLAKAASWLERAESLGETKAMIAMADWIDRGVHYPRDPILATLLIRKAAGNGSAKGAYLLARRTEEGRGCAQNLREAYLSYLSSALQGYRKARAEVARCLRCGIGTAPDELAAEVWRG